MYFSLYLILTYKHQFLASASSSEEDSEESEKCQTLGFSSISSFFFSILYFSSAAFSLTSSSSSENKSSTSGAFSSKYKSSKNYGTSSLCKPYAPSSLYSIMKSFMFYSFPSILSLVFSGIESRRYLSISHYFVMFILLSYLSLYF